MSDPTPENGPPRPLSEQTARRMFELGTSIALDYGRPYFPGLPIPKGARFRLDDKRKLDVATEDHGVLNIDIIELQERPEGADPTIRNQELWTTYTYDPSMISVDQKIKKRQRVFDAEEPMTDEQKQEAEVSGREIKRVIEAQKLEIGLESGDEEEFQRKIQEHNLDLFRDSLESAPDFWEKARKRLEAQKAEDALGLNRVNDEDEIARINNILESLDPKTQLIDPPFKG